MTHVLFTKLLDGQKASPHLESEVVIRSHVHHVANLQEVTWKKKLNEALRFVNFTLYNLCGTAFI